MEAIQIQGITSDDLLQQIREIIREEAILSQGAPPKESYIPRKEAKTLIGIKSDTTMIEFERKGILTPHKVGKKIMYPQGEIEACVKEFRRV